MKIGILTHPQGGNYGGLLQCYALSMVLKQMGHHPIVIRREGNKSFFLWRFVRSILCFLHIPRYYRPNKIDKTKNIRPFVEKHLSRTKPLHTLNQMKQVCKEHSLGAVVVGSDQVWRHDYALNFGYNYFLDFVPDGVTKFSYAASFGLSGWHYAHSETEKIKHLLTSFKGISVREDEGVTLLRDFIGAESVHVLDPTLLLSSKDYDIITDKRLIQDKYIFVYWLGNQDLIKEEIIKYESEGYYIVNINLRDNIELVPVETWLSYIKYADFVITDSFHGVVFSIIFEKKFKILFNTSGGTSRITSLCNLLKINPSEEVDYTQVNNSIKNLKKISLDFIKKMLE